MIDSKKIVEKLLQQFRFNKVKPFLIGDVLDFGGNEGELKPLVKGNYVLVNYDHSPMFNKTFDTIVLLAVIEHMEVSDVFDSLHTFKNALRKDGHIFLTTPTPSSKFILETLAFFRILDKQNIEEHKHYWNEPELFDLAEKAGYEVVKYKKFQFGLNQYILLKHKKA
mgnify:CR=1 FL=1